MGLLDDLDNHRNEQADRESARERERARIAGLTKDLVDDFLSIMRSKNVPTNAMFEYGPDRARWDESGWNVGQVLISEYRTTELIVTIDGRLLVLERKGLNAPSVEVADVRDSPRDKNAIHVGSSDIRWLMMLFLRDKV